MQRTAPGCSAGPAGLAGSARWAEEPVREAASRGQRPPGGVRGRALPPGGEGLPAQPRAHGFCLQVQLPARLAGNRLDSGAAAPGPQARSEPPFPPV